MLLPSATGPSVCACFVFACARAERTTATVILPSTTNATVGCVEPTQQHELIQQRPILCSPEVSARFTLFDTNTPRVRRNDSPRMSRG